MKENVYIQHLESPVGDQWKAASKLHVALGSGLVPDCPEKRGRENQYYMLLGCSLTNRQSYKEAKKDGDNMLL